MDERKPNRIVTLQPRPEDWERVRREVCSRMQPAVPGTPVTDEEAMTLPQPKMLTEEEFRRLQAKFRSMI